jgi:hypothetical protein
MSIPLESPQLAPVANPDAPYGLKKDGTPKKAPGKKKGQTVLPKSGVAKGVANPEPQKQLTPWQQAEQEAQQKEAQFQEDLKEILEASKQYKDFPELKLTHMLMHVKSVDALFVAIAKKVKEGDSKVINRYMDHIVGKPRQQVEVINTQPKNVEKAINEVSTSDLKEFFKNTSVFLAQQIQQPVPVSAPEPEPTISQTVAQEVAPAPVGNTNEVSSGFSPSKPAFNFPNLSKQHPIK